MRSFLALSALLILAPSGFAFGGTSGVGKSAFYCYPGPSGVEVAWSSVPNDVGGHAVTITVVTVGHQSVDCNLAGPGASSDARWYATGDRECVSVEAANPIVDRYGLCVALGADPEWAPLHRFSICADEMCGTGFAAVMRP